MFYQFVNAEVIASQMPATGWELPAKRKADNVMICVGKHVDNMVECARVFCVPESCASMCTLSFKKLIMLMQSGSCKDLYSSMSVSLYGARYLSRQGHAQETTCPSIASSSENDTVWGQSRQNEQLANTIATYPRTNRKRSMNWNQEHSKTTSMVFFFGGEPQSLVIHD